MFNWNEDQFWRTTPHAYFATLDAYRMANDSTYRKRVEFERFRKRIEEAEGGGPSVKPKNVKMVTAKMLSVQENPGGPIG